MFNNKKLQELLSSYKSKIQETELKDKLSKVDPMLMQKILQKKLSRLSFRIYCMQ